MSPRAGPASRICSSTSCSTAPKNAPGSFIGRLEDIGATDWNGTTWFDRTNYFETVPTGALDRALFLESDRMGHLARCALTQKTLDLQRGVVQNEKRMGDNQPGGLEEYAELERAVSARPSLSSPDHRIDGRPQCREPRGREELVPIALWTEQRGARARRRHRRADRAREGRALVRLDSARTGHAAAPRFRCRRCPRR